MTGSSTCLELMMMPLYRLETRSRKRSSIPDGSRSRERDVRCERLVAGNGILQLVCFTSECGQAVQAFQDRTSSSGNNEANSKNPTGESNPNTYDCTQTGVCRTLDLKKQAGTDPAADK